MSPWNDDYWEDEDEYEERDDYDYEEVEDYIEPIREFIKPCQYCGQDMDATTSIKYCSEFCSLSAS